MENNKTVLNIILISVLTIYVFFFSYLIVRYVIPKNSKKKKEKKKEDRLNLQSPYQTDFFNESIKYAERVLFGKEFIPEYGQPDFYANKLLDTVNKLNEDTKKSVIIAIKSNCLEPGACRNNERLYRNMAEQEQVPVWYMILREAIRKVMPEFVIQSNETQNGGKIIPLHQAA